MASVASFRVFPTFCSSFDHRAQFRVRARILENGDSSDTYVSSLGSVSLNGLTSVTKGVDIVKDFVNGVNGKPEKKLVKYDVSKEMEVLWDDGYRSNTVADYFDAAKDIVKPDGGPARWFTPLECGRPVNNSPTLLFLPGLDGTGMGLILHHKALGRVFEVWCLHIPVQDRTPFEGLVKLVEDTVRLEHSSSPGKPIYMVGDSFGGCLALSVAARNPNIDLVVVLVNPATSFGRSQLQPLFPVIEALPDELHVTVPYALSYVMGDPLKMASVGIDTNIPPRLRAEKLGNKLTSMLPLLPSLADIMPKGTLVWKLKLIKSAAAYTNSRLHAVKAEVLILASGKDNMLPSTDEARRLHGLLKDCTIRCFKDNGHTLLLEDGYSLLTIIKSTLKYRQSRKYDYVSDFVPPSLNELQHATDRDLRFIHYAVSSAFFSTLEDGKIVKGLAGVPIEGPVLLVGYHMLLGFELGPLSEAFLKEKNILVRGIAHPELFSGKLESSSAEFGFSDWMKVFGAVPVSATNLFKLFSTNSHILLYPGGAREALHNKGEEYKLFWPNNQEFVRMAARFGATIVPFGVVGEDDLVDLVLDYGDLMKIPILNDYIKQATQDNIRLRDASNGEVANQELFIPGLLPKIPGRFYYLFGKPISTKGQKDFLKDKNNANNLYLHIKSEVERSIDYLLKKREKDPFRNIFDRLVYRSINDSTMEIPTFDP